MNVAIIPARGGSKRIPKKNIKLFAGKPMICWSIEAAKKSGLFDKIIVSTDDKEIADIAKNVGADIPFMRPTEISDDYTVIRTVINHAITEISKTDNKPDNVCCVYPTAPFILSNDIQKAYIELISTDSDFVFTATTYPYPVQRSFYKNKDGLVKYLYPEYANSRSQDLVDTYHDAGQFYWGKTDAFLSNIDSISENSRAYIIPRYRVQDIDTFEDWSVAEVMSDIINKKY